MTEVLSGNTVSIPISIDEAAGSNITVNYETATGSGDGAATADSDFEATTTGTTTIVAGQTTGAINIPILDDFLDEPDESFTVTITGADHAELSTTAADLTNTVTITDNDVPELSISASGHAEEGGNAELHHHLRYHTTSSANDQLYTQKFWFSAFQYFRGITNDATTIGI